MFSASLTKEKEIWRLNVPTLCLLAGHCCFSCKAFFRRAVNWQNKNNRTFQCKFEGRCEITIKNRKTCQACRFQVTDYIQSAKYYTIL